MHHLNHELRGLVRENRANAAALAVTQAAADAAAKENQQNVLDAAGDGDAFVDQWSDASSAMTAAAIVQEWAETNDLGEGEGMADRLFSLEVGAVDEDIDGELDEDQQNDLIDLSNSVGDYLSGLGVSDDDIDALLGDWDNEAGERVQELVAGKLAEGADPSSYAFGDGSTDAALDSVVLDATYKKVLAVRQGRKVKINKRVSGTVRLSAAQKVAVAKMRRKSNTAVAKIRRAKSMRVRAKSGLNK